MQVYARINKVERVDIRTMRERKGLSVRQISNKLKLDHRNYAQMEKNVENYFDFISKLLKIKKIKQEKYDEVIGYLQEETSIYKGKQIIGSLISKKLQEKLGFKMIVPKLAINKSKSKLLLRQGE